jgi:hypothetical protein
MATRTAGEIRSVEEQAREEREQINELGRPDKKKKAGAKKPPRAVAMYPATEHGEPRQPPPRRVEAKYHI